MEDKVEKAIETFRSGYNCAQSVVLTFAKDLEFDENQASAISVGFGGGMGRMQEKCGAVTGAFMVLGMYNSKKHPDNLNRKMESYAMIQKFDDKFKSIHGATDCRKLIGCDIKSEEGHHFAKENNLFEKVCEKCLADSVKLIDELIAG
ncbi:MAG: C-GCAxxG-C-C family protein [Prolixibacteraceae bacterium]